MPTVQNFNTDNYLGTWHEIARLPNGFEKGLSCVTATYSLKTNGKIKVVNKGYKAEKDKWEDITGVAWAPNKSRAAEIKVRFFWPFAGDYFVLSINPDYTQALVGSPSRKFLWILSKSPQMNQTDYEALLKKAEELGFEVGAMDKIDQSCFN